MAGKGGRKPGARNKRTIAIQENLEKWQREGKVLPLEYVLGVAWGEIPGPSTSAEAADRYRANLDAMPFVHPKLASATINADVTTHAPTAAQISEAERLVRRYLDGEGAVIANGSGDRVRPKVQRR